MVVRLGWGCTGAKVVKSDPPGHQPLPLSPTPPPSAAARSDASRACAPASSRLRCCVDGQPQRGVRGHRASSSPRHWGQHPLRNSLYPPSLQQPTGQGGMGAAR
eukprot:975281-Rhodomonas_salina.2